jgi:muramidase (phage lysozyme)
MSNLDAFLTMIATSEGTAAIGDRGYNCIVGSTPQNPHLFPSYADHPRIKVQLRPGLVSTAAGRYQILEHIYDAYKAQLGLKDFSPKSQDTIAEQLIRERHAFADVEAGRFDEAVSKCANIWASFAGSTYGQPTHKMEFLADAYTKAGGTLA